MVILWGSGQLRLKNSGTIHPGNYKLKTNEENSFAKLSQQFE